jgi:hypothetical protein
MMQKHVKQFFINISRCLEGERTASCLLNEMLVHFKSDSETKANNPLEVQLFD